MGDGCTTLLPQLEPVLGIGLALNLAYLNLPVFHFLNKISEGVGAKLKKLQAETVDQVRDTSWYKDSIQVSRVCDLESVNYDEDQPRWIQFKSKWVAALFNILYYYRTGKILSIVCTVLGCLFITLGVAISIKSENAFICASVDLIGVPFGLSVFIFLWPIVCITTGATLNYVTQKNLNYHLRNLGKKALTDAKGAVADVEKALGK